MSGTSGNQDMNVIPHPQYVKAEKKELLFLDASASKICLKAKHARISERILREFPLSLNRKARKTVEIGEEIDSDTSLCFETVSDEELARKLIALGLINDSSSLPWDQAYLLRTSENSSGVQVTCQATSPVGHHYGILTLAQLLQPQDDGVVVPLLHVADWPSIPLRLGKTSASRENLPALKDFCRWLTLGKINLMGLQYHGCCSRTRETEYQERMMAMGKQVRREGALGLIAYCSPFRAKKRNDKCVLQLEDEDDLELYITWLIEMIDSGASGIEIDYNDPQPEYCSTPNKIALIFMKIYQAVRERKGDAIILHCPPRNLYKGKAKPDMAAISQMLPPDFYFLWTGPGPGPLIPEHPIPVKEFEQWAEKMRRKPFLWVNRVSADTSFALKIPLDGNPNASIIRTNAFPRNLPDLVSGIHLNFSGRFWKNASNLAYFATACDYFWNPHEFNPERSWHSAWNFIETFSSFSEIDRSS